MTVTITGFTAARAQAIEDQAIVDGSVVSGNLILERNDGSTINAGSVVGPAGPAGVITCTSTTRPTATVGQAIWETDTKKFLIYNGIRWDPPWNTAWGWVAGATVQADQTPSGTPPSALITSASAVWTAVANRRHLVVVRTRVGVTTGAGRITVAVENAAGGDVDLQSIYADNNNAEGFSLSWSYHETGIPAGSNTRRLRAAMPSGTSAGVLQVIGTAGIGTQIHVFDDGPNGNPV